MITPEDIKSHVPEIVEKFSTKSDTKAAIQLVNTLVPYFILFYLTVLSLNYSVLLFVLNIAILSLFQFRIFILMHDCGHKSLFRSKWGNSISGVVTGVLVGLPYYVWAQHHNFHHATNGNWEKYRGPLSTLSLEEYDKLSPLQKKFYYYYRSLPIAPLGGFLYFILNPRVNWIMGLLQLAVYVIREKLSRPDRPLRNIIDDHQSKYWKTGTEFRHMSLNNILLFTIWGFAAYYFGAAEFFTVYLISLSLAGGAGITVFSVQHNFENSYASDTARCNYYRAAIYGTSFLQFPRAIKWFSAGIGYHHIHHLSAGIPNYNLESCHREYSHLFGEVKRIKFREIPHCLDYILWDENNEKLVSISAYNQLNLNEGSYQG